MGTVCEHTVVPPALHTVVPPALHTVVPPALALL